MSTRNLILGSLFLCLSLVMPSVLHILGPSAGKMFLPLFIGVGLSSLLLPISISLVVAILTPILSNFLTSMPPLPLMYFMLIELVIYAFSIRILREKFNTAITVLFSLTISRVSYLVIASISGLLFSLPKSLSFGMVLSSIIVSIPGIIIQVILFPILVKVFRGYYVECTK